MRKPNANDAAELKSIGKWARVGLMHLAPIAASQILGIDFLPVAYPAPESIAFFLANGQAPARCFSYIPIMRRYLVYRELRDGGFIDS